MKKVSFDFDSTLSRQDVQEYAKSLVDAGHEVWIVTSRYDNTTIASSNRHLWMIEWNDRLFEVADKCGIKRDNIIFTCMISKVEFLRNEGFLFHLDDDDVELEEIAQSSDPCVPIQVFDANWKDTCENILNKS